MEINRRDFLKKWALAVLLTSQLWRAVAETSDASRNNSNTILTNEALAMYNKSISLIWNKEMDYFLLHFSIEDPIESWISVDEKNRRLIELIDRVKETQKMLGFNWDDVDWIIWPNTLRRIYLKNYVNFEENLPLEIKTRLKVCKELEWYKQKPGALHSRLNPFSNSLFYWRSVWENKSGTYINEEMYWKIPKEITSEQPANLIKIIKLGWKIWVAMYINHKLHVATFVSPGLINHSTPGMSTNWTIIPDLLHTSSSYPKSTTERPNQGWAVMPYAVHINWPIWLHWSDGRIDWNPASHWCIRVPLYYIQEIFRQVKRLWINNVTINTNWIY